MFFEFENTYKYKYYQFSALCYLKFFHSILYSNDTVKLSEFFNKLYSTVIFAGSLVFGASTLVLFLFMLNPIFWIMLLRHLFSFAIDCPMRLHIHTPQFRLCGSISFTVQYHYKTLTQTVTWITFDNKIYQSSNVWNP